MGVIDFVMLYWGFDWMILLFFSYFILGLGSFFILYRTEYVGWLDEMVWLVGGYFTNCGRFEIIDYILIIIKI